MLDNSVRHKVFAVIPLGAGFIALFLVALDIGPISIPFSMIKPLLMLWLIADAFVSMELYRKQDGKEHYMRLVRAGVTVAWFVGLLNPLIAGIVIILDGAYSIFRYRNNSFTRALLEDLPRIFRIEIGFWIITGLSIVTPALHLV